MPYINKKNIKEEKLEEHLNILLLRSLNISTKCVCCVCMSGVEGQSGSADGAGRDTDRQGDARLPHRTPCRPRLLQPGMKPGASLSVNG